MKNVGTIGFVDDTHEILHIYFDQKIYNVCLNNFALFALVYLRHEVIVLSKFFSPAKYF